VRSGPRAETAIWRRLGQALPGRALGAWRAARARPAPERLYGALYACLLVLYLVPLLVTPLLPGLDLPFHIALADMLSKSGRPDSPYAPFYAATLSFHPYVAYYVVLLGLSKAMSLLAAHKLVVAAYVAGFPAATAALLGACGRSRLPALFAFPLAYNLALHYGFMSFALSLPILLWFLAAVVRTIAANEAAARRWALVALLACVLFLSHLQAFLFGLCAALAFVAFSRAPWRRRIFVLSTILPAAALMALWQARSVYADDPERKKMTLRVVWDLFWAARGADTAGRSIGADLLDRITGIHHHLLRGFLDAAHVRWGAIILLTMVGYVALGGLGRLFPAPGPEPRSRFTIAGLIVFAGAAAAYLGFPHHLPEFELTTFSPRFSVLAALMLVLLVPASLGRLPGAWAAVAALPAFVVCAGYGVVLVGHYRLYGKEVSDFHDVLEKTPAGGKALGLVFERYSKVMANESILMSLPSFYVGKQNHPQSMVALSFCQMRHIPCRHRSQDPKRHPIYVPWTPESVPAEAAVAFYDYFFVKSQPPGLSLFGPHARKLEVLARKGPWVVYRKRTPPGPEGR
jgi:hypothetical protein